MQKEGEGETGSHVITDVQRHRTVASDKLELTGVEARGSCFIRRPEDRARDRESAGEDTAFS